MKKTMKTLGLVALVALASCGQSADEKNKIIEEAAKLRADQVCQNGNGSLDDYGKYMNYLTEQLSEQGITSKEETDAAIKLFDEKIKASCPDKMPK